MITQFAQMFSTNGVLLHGTRNVLVPGPPSAPPGAANGGSQKPNFNQASAQLDLSPQARAQMAAAADAKNDGEGDSGGSGNGGQANGASAPDEKHPDGTPLNESEKKELHALKQRDTEVHAHEQAHQATAGSLAKGGPQFDYQKGPNGKKYAIGGHVDIDSSPVPGNPEATLRKAEAVQQAALAPGDPSGPDKAVAAAAAQMANEASRQLNGGKTDASGQFDSSKSSGGGNQSGSPNQSEQSDCAQRSARVSQALEAYVNQEAETGSSLNAYA